MTENIEAEYGSPSKNEVDLASYLDFLVDNRKLIISVAVLITLIGLIYAFVAHPVYESDIMVQVEENPGSTESLLGSASPLLNVKSDASTEVSIIGSRLVVASAVDKLKLYIVASPSYFPVVGQWLARRYPDAAIGGLFRKIGFAAGGDTIDVGSLTVPPDLIGETFKIKNLGGGRFEIVSQEGQRGEGRVGLKTDLSTPEGLVSIVLNSIEGEPGALFRTKRLSREETIASLQAELKITQPSSDSDIINASLQGSDPTLVAAILSQVGHEYVQQNIHRKSAEASNSLAFLESELPRLKSQLEAAEQRYNSYRHTTGTLDLSEEGTLLLRQTADLEATSLQLQQQRTDLAARFTPAHPAVAAINAQIAKAQAQLDELQAHIKALPAVEQTAVRLMRDVRVDTELYTALLNSAQQLRVVEAGQTGNVRLIDDAAVPEIPIKPKRPLVIGASILLGVLVGAVVAFLRDSLFGGMTSPLEIESATGLSVYSTIPFSPLQEAKSASIRAGARGITLLAQSNPQDPAIESLRSLRTALQFALLESNSNVVMMTGPTPGVGKSFVSLNFADVLASGGKKILLVDADLHRGYLHEHLGIGRQNGLSEILASSVTFGDVVHRNYGSGFDFISTGSLPPNAAELLMVSQFKRSLDEWSQAYDLVIVDTPPVLSLSDAQVIGANSGIIFLVTRAELNTIGEVKESIRRMSQVGLKIKGVVFNGLKLRAGRYGYGSKYGRFRYARYAYYSYKNEE